MHFGPTEIPPYIKPSVDAYVARAAATGGSSYDLMTGRLQRHGDYITFGEEEKTLGLKTDYSELTKGI
ncbi:hypothetical protein GCM10020370_52820 [Paenibacillus hodogayensis]